MKGELDCLAWGHDGVDYARAVEDAGDEMGHVLRQLGGILPASPGLDGESFPDAVLQQGIKTVAEPRRVVAYSGRRLVDRSLDPDGDDTGNADLGEVHQV